MLAVAGIGEEIQAIAQIFQLFHQRIRAVYGLDRPLQLICQDVCRSVETLREPLANQLCRLLLRQAAPVHLGPLQRSEHLNKQGPPVLRRYAQLLDKKLRIKAQQYVAHVKDNVFNHQTIFTFPFVTLNTISREMIVVRVSMVARAAAVPSLMRTTS